MYDSFAFYRRKIEIELKTREDENYYYVSCWFNGFMIKEYKGKDYYKTKDRLYNYIRYTYNINLI